MKKFLILILILPLFISTSTRKVRIPKDFAFIPMGSSKIKGKVYSTSAFIMQKHEVTNKQYREFLNDLKANNEIEKLKIAQIDSVKWRDANKYNEPYVTYYHSHPAYDNYPVVNISFEAVQLYCQWLSAKWTKTYGQNFEFRLPSEIEWMYAAKGGKNNKYPWDGIYLRNKKGEFRCNFKIIYQKELKENPETKEITIAQDKPENTTIMSPVNSYFPNEYGLYNMSGNAAEMTSEKGVIKGGSWNSVGYYMQIETEGEYSEKDIPSPFVGFRVIYSFLPSRDK